MKIAEPIRLPCGVTLKNRLAKSAMSENMAKPGYFAGQEFYNLYKRWAEGGIGLSISGNVMIDRKHLGEANNVVIEEGLDNHQGLKEWASAYGNTGNQIWVQLNHPGRQIPKFLSTDNVSASAVPFDKPMDTMFATPRTLTEGEILDIIQR
ncbi:MAG: NADH oxidase, partial [Leptospiraceae bacterium]|nr:NADH oxidase [Leptospiraceae bacterium]